MKRLGWFSGLGAAFLAVAHLALAQVGAPVAGASGPPSGSYTSAQQISAAQSLHAPLVLHKSAVPFVWVATGTMANNGALTVGTALPRVYPNAYFFLPTNAIVAGSAAGWYLTQCTTTTACVVCNNVYTTGPPTLPSCTPFVTTGPGAYTGVTGAQAGIQITVPASSMGASGVVEAVTVWEQTNNANAKTVSVLFGATNMTALSVASQASATQFSLMANNGATNAQQSGTPNAVGGFGATGTAPNTGTSDTTADVTVTYSGNKGTATDNLVNEVRTLLLFTDGT